LHDLWNGPKQAEPYGAATIGSSEACMLAGLTHKWNWRQAQQKAGKDVSRPNMVTGGNVQIVWKGSATVLMQYYMFLRFGRNGYTRIMRYALDHAMYLRDRLIRGGKFQIMNQAQRIPVVALTLDGSVKGYNEFDISNKVREKGWILSAYSMPPDAQEVNTCELLFARI
jgi:glutamate/tyrosine decarboxylase-like PLP-dependent enzyme